MEFPLKALLSLMHSDFSIKIRAFLSFTLDVLEVLSTSEVPFRLKLLSLKLTALKATVTYKNIRISEILILTYCNLKYSLDRTNCCCMPHWLIFSKNITIIFYISLTNTQKSVKIHAGKLLLALSTEYIHLVKVCAFLMPFSLDIEELFSADIPSSLKHTFRWIFWELFTFWHQSSYFLATFSPGNIWDAEK